MVFVQKHGTHRSRFLDHHIIHVHIVGVSNISHPFQKTNQKQTTFPMTPYFVGMFPYIGLIYMVGTSNLGSWNGHWLILKTKHDWATKMHRASTKPVDNVDKQAKTWLPPNTSNLQIQGGKLGRQRDKEVVTGWFPLQTSGQYWSMGYIVKSKCLMIKTCWNMLVGGWAVPSEKWWSSSVGMMTFPTYGKLSKIHVPNHQAVLVITTSYPTKKALKFHTDADRCHFSPYFSKW